MYKRKYKYPSDFISKKGTLKKNRRKQINKWINTLKNHNLNSYNSLMLHNYFLEKQLVDYSNALEKWVLYSQFLSK